MLLSPRSRKYPDGYATCSICYTGMQPQMACKKTPPKFAIANGFGIGSFPREIKFFNKEGQRVTREVEDEELTDTLKAMVAPVRPYGCVFAYSGGAQKSLRGNYQFFEMEQNRLGGVMNHLNQAGIGEHIYCVLCGRMTPDQKQIVRKRARIDTQLYIDILTWFVKESGHPGYLNTSIPEGCPQPFLVEDNPTKTTLTIHPTRPWKLITKAGLIISPLHKTRHNTRQYMDPLIFLHLPCFSVLHQLCWHTVEHMPKMLT